MIEIGYTYILNGRINVICGRISRLQKAKQGEARDIHLAQTLLSGMCYVVTALFARHGSLVV